MSEAVGVLTGTVGEGVDVSGDCMVSVAVNVSVGNAVGKTVGVLLAVGRERVGMIGRPVGTLTIAVPPLHPAARNNDATMLVLISQRRTSQFSEASADNIVCYSSHNRPDALIS